MSRACQSHSKIGNALLSSEAIDTFFPENLKALRRHSGLARSFAGNLGGKAKSNSGFAASAFGMKTG
jgi:hypothetical protein